MNVIILYVLIGLICDAINCCVLSFNMNKINIGLIELDETTVVGLIYDKITIEKQA